MNIKELILKTRTFRRFDESFNIDTKTIESFIDLARLSPSGANKQPLKFMVFNTPEDCNKVFPYLAWAGYFTEWPGPDKGERPSAYIVILGDTTLSENFGVDHGIAAHSILLGAVDSGLGGCIIGSIKRNEFCSELSIPERYEVLLVIALGKPVENVILEELHDGNVKYWRDADQNHHVPKRNLGELIVRFK